MIFKTSESPVSVVREIKQKTRRKFNPKETIRITLEGLKGEDSIPAICRREFISPAYITNEVRRFYRQVLSLMKM